MNGGGALGRRASRLAEALGAVDAAIDWAAMGELYCHEGGEQFFPPQQREAVRDAGLAFAADLGSLVRPGGRSHYLGAAVAELPIMLFETIVLERKVHWTRLPGLESELLAEAMHELPGPTPRPPCPPPWPVDHLWCVSVLTDPDAFGALHDQLYERSGGRAGNLEAERERAERLVEDALDDVAPPAILSTTDEEAPFFQQASTDRDWQLVFPSSGRLSGIVGDVVRHAGIELR